MARSKPAENGKRSTLRTPTEAAVTCRRYTSNGAERSTEGVMRNFSSDGAYIETARPFKSGTTLLMRMLRYPPTLPDASGDDRPRSICLAEVKWQQTLVDDDTVRYGMGVRYLE